MGSSGDAYRDCSREKPSSFRPARTRDWSSVEFGDAYLISGQRRFQGDSHNSTGDAAKQLSICAG